MNKTIKTLIILLAAVTATGCRPAKQENVTAASTDSMSISIGTFSDISQDSLSISEESSSLVYDSVRFVEGGGSVSVSADGSVFISGVAEVKSSRLRTTESNAESKSLFERSQSNESVSDTHQALSVSESHVDCSASSINWKLETAVLMLIALLIPIIVRRLWKGSL